MSAPSTNRSPRKILSALFLGVPWLSVVALLAAAEYARTDGWLTRGMLELWSASSRQAQLALIHGQEAQFPPPPEPQPQWMSSEEHLAHGPGAEPMMYAFAVDPDKATEQALEMLRVPALEERLREIEIAAAGHEAEATRAKACEQAAKSLAASRASLREMHELRASNIVVRTGKLERLDPSSWRIDVAATVDTCPTTAE